MSRNDITVDDRGWAQAKNRPSWTPREEGHTRRGLPWGPAEDRALLQGVAEARAITWNDPTILAAARVHGRSSCAIATRVSALKAGLRLSAETPTP
jgi:hypothetical protein